ncbi:hypothetical protein M0638_08240 [Roseomonas sp. NAR14]|uniref:Uncharacterized protein n=1 Tax=Roseomonas acroporae TaxID=2937791 RepID=A0A9X1YD42_9PROT|nr:hypothetical protein [Roseomonas acroporae]MCK8784366.1 hypothetical protein [Roseomonas acroporae]
MSDPTPPVIDDKAAVLSVEVPYAAGSATKRAYLRLGTQDTTSVSEPAFWPSGTAAADRAGILMLSPDGLVINAGHMDTVVFGEQTFNMVHKAGLVRSASYTFPEDKDQSIGDKTARNVSYTLGHASAFNAGDTEALNATQTTTITLGNSQAMTAGAGLVASTGATVSAAASVMSVAANLGKVDVQSVVGDVKMSRVNAVVGSTSVLLGISPVTETVLGGNATLVGIIQGVLAVFATAAAGIEAGFALQLTSVDPIEPGNYATVDTNPVKDKLASMRDAYYAALGVMSTVQAAGLVLGAVALKLGMGAQAAAFPRIEMDATGIKLLADPTVSLVLTPATAIMTAGASVLTMGPAQTDLTATNLGMTGQAMFMITSPDASISSPLIDLSA